MLHLAFAVAPARTSGMLIFSLSVEDLLSPHADEIERSPLPSDMSLPSAQLDVIRLSLLVVELIRSVRHFVERLLMLIDDVPIRLS